TRLANGLVHARRRPDAEPNAANPSCRTGGQLQPSDQATQQSMMDCTQRLSDRLMNQSSPHARPGEVLLAEHPKARRNNLLATHRTVHAFRSWGRPMSSRAEIKQRLALVDERIKLDTEHVRRQRQMVDEIEQNGLDAGQSKRALAALVDSLSGHL